MNNQKGQALIEALGFLTLTLCGSLLLLAVLYQSTLEIAVDDQLESFLICQIQGKSTCESDLQDNLRQLKITVLRQNTQNLQSRFSIEIEYELPMKKYFSQYAQLNISTIKNRELHFEKNID